MKLNNTTKKARYFINKFNESSCYSVRDFYKTCSSAKLNAEEKIKNTMANYGGYDYRILSGNPFSFTCGYKINNILIIETVSSTFEIEL